MSHVVDHVNEAQLHAYLDRDLEFANREVRNAVGAHIADCSKCSALLKEVRQVYKASNQLLDVSAPPARPTPSFEDIVKQAAERRADNAAESSSSRFLRTRDTTHKEPSDEFEIDIAIGESEDRVEIVAENDESESVDIPGTKNAQDVGDIQDVADTPDFEEVLPVDTGADIEVVEPEAVQPPEAVQFLEDVQSLEEVQSLEGVQSLEDVQSLEGVQSLGQVPGLAESPDAGDHRSDNEIEEAFSPVSADPPSIAETHPAPIEPDIPSADEVVFIDAETPLVEEGPETPAPLNTTTPSKPKRGRATRVLALAATIVVAVGIGGWFGRPYILERFGNGSPTVMAASQNREQEAATPPNTLRQELQESAASNAPADGSALASGAAGQANVDSAEILLEDRVGAATAVAEELASSFGGRTIVGSVRDAASKRAVTGARVALLGTGQVARTDSQGRFQIRDVPLGSVSVDVVGAGYERSEKGLTVSDSQGTVADFELRRSDQLADERVASPARSVRAREVDRIAPPIANDAAAWTEATRLQAESVLGGQLIAIEGLEIARIERTQGQAAIRVTQLARNGNPIFLQINSPGQIGAGATLESVVVTSAEGSMPSTGRATYGNYLVNVEAMVSDVELESLLRRITLAPEIN